MRNADLWYYTLSGFMVWRRSGTIRSRHNSISH